jgi:hypothetical protein
MAMAALELAMSLQQKDKACFYWVLSLSATPPSATQVITMPGVAVSPEVVLHRTLQKLERVKAVVVVIMLDDDSMYCDWSSLKPSELAMASLVLDSTARNEICPED